MKILAVDTSTRMGSIALVEGPRLVAEIRLDAERSNAERLLPAIETLLKKAGWGLSDLNGLAVTIGPGSFTGLRIGLATLKGFAHAHSLPLAGVSSLSALAHNGVLSQWPVAAILNAGRGEIFSALYRFDKGRMSEVLLPEQCVKPEAFRDALKKQKGCWLIGEGALRHESLFREGLGEKAYFPPLPLMHLQAKWAAWLALPILEKGDGKDWKRLTPRYLRLSDAEIKKGKHG